MRASIVSAVGIMLFAAAWADDVALPSLPPAPAGLYELRKTSNMAIFIGRDLSQVAPEEQQRLSDEALTKPGPVFRICVPPGGEAIIDKLTGHQASGCSYSNLITTENGFAVDSLCAGKQPFHVIVKAESPEHRTISVSGQQMPKASIPLVDHYDIQRITADCGDLPPGQVKRMEKLLSSSWLGLTRP